MTVFRLRRSGRSSPVFSQVETGSTSSGLSSSRTGSGVSCELGVSPAGSPPTSAAKAPVGTPRKQRPSARLTFLLALLPALVALGTVASLSRRHAVHSDVADALLAASVAAGGGALRSARQLGEATDVAEGQACAEALQIPQVGLQSTAAKLLGAWPASSLPRCTCAPAVSSFATNALHHWRWPLRCCSRHAVHLQFHATE